MTPAANNLWLNVLRRSGLPFIRCALARSKISGQSVGTAAPSWHLPAIPMLSRQAQRQAGLTGLSPPKSLRDFEAKWARRTDPLCFSGVWRFRELMPFYRSEDQIVTIGEGQTILQQSATVGRYVGLEPGGLFLQYEGLNPSGSFKDNGMTAAFTHAKMVGARKVACASTGNTSASPRHGPRSVAPEDDVARAGAAAAVRADCRAGCALGGPAADRRPDYRAEEGVFSRPRRAADVRGLALEVLLRALDAVIHFNPTIVVLDDPFGHRQPQPHAQPHAQIRQSAPVARSRPRSEEDFRLNLSDIPMAQDSLEVEGFKPSLLSRLFDVIAPLKRR